LPKKVAFRKMRFLSAQALRNAWQGFGYRNVLSETIGAISSGLGGRNKIF
jgi:hypothetical protein